MTTPRLIVSLAVAAFVIHAADVRAQGAFPAPLPGQAAAPAGSSPFPPVNGATGAPISRPPADSAFSNGAAPLGGGFGMQQQQAGPPGGAECQTGFLALRTDAEAKAKLIQAAGKRKAPPAEACKLIGNFSQAELKMIKFVETNAKKCGIPPDAAVQMKKGHVNTEQLQSKVCAIAAQGGGAGPAGPGGPSLSEALGSAAAIPEAKATKKGGSTFDTLNGNVLTR